MKKTYNPELSQAINQYAHVLAAQSFPSFRVALQERADAMLKEGKSLAETIRTIRTAGGHPKWPSP